MKHHHTQDNTEKGETAAMKRFLTLLLLFCLFGGLTGAFGPLAPAFAAETTADDLSALPPADDEAALPVTRRRALLISCDHFVTYADTDPGARSGAQLFASVLERDRNGYESIISVSDAALSASLLSMMVRDAFSEAAENDISVIYIATHGLVDQDHPDSPFSFVFSDGQREFTVPALSLSQILQQIPGQVLLITDTCFSGMMLGKGTDTGAPNVFEGTGIQVLCSAGGNEQSFYYKDGQDTYSASFFSVLLSRALGLYGEAFADEDKDGQITLAELRASLTADYALCTAQCYPENSPAVVYTVNELFPFPEAAVTDIEFDNSVLSGGGSEASFSFTVTREARLFYQIIYFRQGVWQFDGSEITEDTAEGELLTPGQKQRTIRIADDAGHGDNSGYAIVHLYTLREGSPVLLYEKLINAQPEDTELHVSIETPYAFSPEKGAEAVLLIRHDQPCTLSVSIRDAEGRVVRHLCYSRPSRPQNLLPDGTALVWDGLNDQNAPAPAGIYTVSARAVCSGTVFTAESEPFRLE